MLKTDIKKIEYFLFDLDGTLTDSSEGITKCSQLALKKIGVDVSRDELLSFIGPSLRYSFGKYTDSADEVMLCLNTYRKRYGEVGIYECKLYDGIASLLKTLRDNGKKVVLASAKPELFCRKILTHFKIDGYFEFIGGATFDGKMDDKAVLIKYVLDNIGNPPSDKVIMIGDRKYDVEGAHANGIASVGVGFGFGTRAELEEANADFVVDTVDELTSLLTD